MKWPRVIVKVSPHRDLGVGPGQVAVDRGPGGPFQLRDGPENGPIRCSHGRAAVARPIWPHRARTGPLWQCARHFALGFALCGYLLEWSVGRSGVGEQRASDYDEECFPVRAMIFARSCCFFRRQRHR